MEGIVDFFREPWTFEFMQRGLLAAAIVSAVAAVVGSLVILKGMAFISDALPHASFSGVAVAFALGENLYVGGGVAALLTALAIGYVSRRGVIRNDTAIGIIFVGAFALGILIVSLQDNYTGDLFSFVFGNVLAVSWNDVWLTAAVAAVVVLIVVLFYKELLFNAFDPTMAQASGLPVAWIEYGLLALLALVTMIALQTVGIVLVVALLVTPAATAQLLTRRLSTMMLVAAAIGVASSVVGLYGAWHADVSASAAIVLTATGAFIAAFLFAPGRGAVWRGGAGSA